MKHLVIYLSSFLAAITTTCSAQPTAFRWREEIGSKYVGVNFSTSRYNGDLSERYNVAHLQLGWAVEGHARYRLKEHWCINGEIGFYHVRGDQQYTSNKANYLAFSSINFSANVGLQWDIKAIDFNLRNIPYLRAGVGVTKLSPTTSLSGITYSLPDFQTEGKAYARWVGQIHYGCGFPVTVNPTTQLRFETRYTHVLSDYMDDVSAQYVDKSAASMLEKTLADKRIAEGMSPNLVGATRGNGKKNDGYFLLTLQLVHKFR